MTLYVNGVYPERKTELNLFGNLSLITDDIVGKIFDTEIKGQEFIIDGLNFKPYGIYDENEYSYIYIVSEA